MISIRKGGQHDIQIDSLYIDRYIEYIDKCQSIGLLIKLSFRDMVCIFVVQQLPLIHCTYNDCMLQGTVHKIQQQALKDLQRTVQLSTSGHCTQCTAKGFKARSMQCKIIVYFRELYTKYSQSTCKALYNYLLQGTVHKVQPKHLQSTVHKVQQYSLKHSQSTVQLSTSGHCTQSTAIGFKGRVKDCAIVNFRALYTKYSQSIC